jgi:hypothetical protein
MKFLQKSKDGGPQSTVDAFWLFEIKWLASIAILRFGSGSRAQYHGHAFDAISWLFGGRLVEQLRDLPHVKHAPSLKPIITRRSTVHRTVSVGTSYALTFRGPWTKTWPEYDPETGKDSVLTHGRKVVG